MEKQMAENVLNGEEIYNNSTDFFAVQNIFVSKLHAWHIMFLILQINHPWLLHY